MRTSEKIEPLIKALITAQKELVAPPKNRTAKIRMKSGGEYTYKYADLTDVIDIIKPILQKNGFCVSQAPQVQADQKQVLTTRLMHESGSWIESAIALPELNDPQVLGSWITYLRRYSLCAILGIASDEDDDGASAKASKPTPTNAPKVTPAGQNPPIKASMGDKSKVPASDKQRKMLWAKLKSELNFDDTVAKDFIHHFTGKESGKDLSMADVDILVKEIEKAKSNNEPGSQG